MDIYTAESALNKILDFVKLKSEDNRKLYEKSKNRYRSLINTCHTISKYMCEIIAEDELSDTGDSAVPKVDDNEITLKSLYDEVAQLKELFLYSSPNIQKLANAEKLKCEEIKRDDSSDNVADNSTHVADTSNEVDDEYDDNAPTTSIVTIDGQQVEMIHVDGITFPSCQVRNEDVITPEYGTLAYEYPDKFPPLPSNIRKSIMHKYLSLTNDQICKKTKWVEVNECVRYIQKWLDLRFIKNGKGFKFKLANVPKWIERIIINYYIYLRTHKIYRFKKSFEDWEYEINNNGSKYVLPFAVLPENQISDISKYWDQGYIWFRYIIVEFALNDISDMRPSSYGLWGVRFRQTFNGKGIGNKFDMFYDSEAEPPHYLDLTREESERRADPFFGNNK